MPETQLLMLGILPRGDGTNSSTTYTWPGIYTRAIHAVNEWLVSTAEEVDKISYLDCGPMLLYNGKVSSSTQLSMQEFFPAGQANWEPQLQPYQAALQTDKERNNVDTTSADSSGLPLKRKQHLQIPKQLSMKLSLWLEIHRLTGRLLCCRSVQPFRWMGFIPVPLAC